MGLHMYFYKTLGSSSRNSRQHNPESVQAMQAVQEDRDNNSMDNLTLRLGEFLTTVLQDALTAPRVRHWEAQLSADECYDVVTEHIAMWSNQHVGGHFYSIPELLLHKRMWDVMTRNKSGLPKEQHFTYWCRRVAACKQPALPQGTPRRTALLQSMLTALPSEHWQRIF